MKKVISVSIIAFLFISLFSVTEIVAQKKNNTVVSNTAKVEVYYFHYTHRCVTCKAVEAESQKAIQELYPAQYKSGKVVFKSINLEEDKNKSIGEKYKVEGQSLLIISGNKRFDLTEQGFMNARTKPKKLKEEIKKVIDPLI